MHIMTVRHQWTKVFLLRKMKMKMIKIGITIGDGL